MYVAQGCDLWSGIAVLISGLIKTVADSGGTRLCKVDSHNSFWPRS
jgi:hypothetical protein